MKVTLDITRLLEDGRITPRDHDRLLELSRETSTPVVLNLLVGMGMVTVTASLLALIASWFVSIVAGALLCAGGHYVGTAFPKDWGLLGAVCLVIGALVVSVGLVGLLEGHPIAYVLVAAFAAVAAVVAKSGILASFSAFALFYALGALTAYGHACYALFVKEPTITVAVFTALGFGAFYASKGLPADHERLALIFARSCLLIINLGFWVGSIWGDRLLPDVVLGLAWAAAIVAATVWALGENRMFVVNMCAVFGAVHFYTQWFERLGANPFSILVAGILMIAFAVGLKRFNDERAGGAIPVSYAPVPRPAAPSAPAPAAPPSSGSPLDM